MEPRDDCYWPQPAKSSSQKAVNGAKYPSELRIVDGVRTATIALTVDRDVSPVSSFLTHD